MKVRDLIRLLESDGWKHVRTTGSHRHFKHPVKPNVVTVPGNPGHDIPIGTLKDSHWDTESHSEISGIGGEAVTVKYAVIFEKARGNWAAYVPDLPGCMTTGRSLDETKQNIREAILGHLETLREFGDPVPEPASVAGEVEVTGAA